MSTPNPDDLRRAQTSSGGTSGRRPFTTAITLIALPVLFTGWETTVSGYENPPAIERTSTEPVGYIVPAPPETKDKMPAHLETTGEAVLEIRRRSGLTWEELGDLFEVKRRSVHHWASGKPASAKHEQKIRRILAAIRRLDQGNQAATRAQLLSVDEGRGGTALDLFKQGRFEETEGRVDRTRASEYHPTPLSDTVQEARRPPAPALLLEALQDRPVGPAQRVGGDRATRAVRTARAARAARVAKKMA